MFVFEIYVFFNDFCPMVGVEKRLCWFPLEAVYRISRQGVKAAHLYFFQISMKYDGSRSELSMLYQNL